MKIKPNQDFRHDYGLFKKDETYEVPEDLGRYFVGVGWALALSASADLKKHLEHAPVTVPPGQFRVDKDCNVEEFKDEVMAQGRNMSPDLEIQDSKAGQEADL